MDNAIIYDLIPAAVLVLGVVIGAKRGLIRSLVGLLAVVAALLGAALVANAAAGPVTESLWPSLEEKMVEKYTADLDARTERGLSDPDALSELAALLERYGVDEDSQLRKLLSELEESLRAAGDNARERTAEASREILISSVKALFGTVVHAAVFLAAFLLLLLLIRLLTGLLDKVFDLPVLSTINGLGGALFGLTEAVLLLFLALWLARRFGYGDRLDALADGTYLVRFFLNNTPHTLISILLNGR